MRNEFTRAKTFDLYGQVAMFALPILADLIIHDARFIFYILFTVGTWQVISTLVHIRFRKQPWIIPGRRMYNITLATVFIILSLTGVITFIDNRIGSALFVEAYAMIIVGIAMGIWYIAISAIELKRIKTPAVDNWDAHIGEQY